MPKKRVLFIHGGKVENQLPVAHFLLRLQAAVDYHATHSNDEDIVFFVSGRWTNVTDDFAVSEAEAGRRWIKSKLPAANVMTEDISVELIGNFAFSKPLVSALNPDAVIIFTSELLVPRVSLIAERIFASTFAYEVKINTTELSDNKILVERESCAAELFSDVFQNCSNGDDAHFRDTLLYSTPYYFKGTVDDKLFFDTYWRGGFEHHLNSRVVRKSLA